MRGTTGRPCALGRTRFGPFSILGRRNSKLAKQIGRKKTGKAAFEGSQQGSFKEHKMFV